MSVTGTLAARDLFERRVFDRYKINNLIIGRRFDFMINEFQVVFHNIDQTQALIEAVRKRLHKLTRFCDQILDGRVVLDSPHNNHHKGKVYSVGIEIHSPAGKIRVHQGQHDNHTHEDLYVTIRDAFNVAERQLKAASKKHRIITPNRGRLYVKAA